MHPVIGKLRRRLKRVRSSIAGYEPQLSNSHHVRTWPVRDAAHLLRTHALLSVLGSRRNRHLITLPPGRTVARIECSDGVDFEGADETSELWWDGPEDTVMISGRDVEIRSLKITHAGESYAYAVHSDGPGRGGRVGLHNVIVTAARKSALGIGIAGGQTFVATGCTFIREAFPGDDSPTVFAHNWEDQHSPCRAELIDCTTSADHGGRAALWRDLGSGQPDVVVGIASE